MTADLVVTRRHLLTVPYYNARPGFCRDKSKAWARRHGIDWRSFLRQGIPASRLEATGDAFALALVRWARECESRERAAALEHAHG